MKKIIVNGFRGKLGRAICDVIMKSEDCELTAGVDSWVPVPAETLTYPSFTDISDCDMSADVIIDCHLAEYVPKVIGYATEKKTPLIICTTGLSDGTLSLIGEAAESIAVLRSANMSLGINLMTNILGRVSELLSESGFDIEIVESHHNQKTDSPSGTAVVLAEAMNRDGRFEYTYGRTPDVRVKRSKKEIGFHSIRGGTIIGEHSVIFAGRDEIIEIKHTAISKDLFAVGAVKAAKFMAGKSPGLYCMDDVINS